MTWTTSPRHLADLAFRLADHGTAPLEVELAWVAAEASRHGVAPGAVAALVDAGSPEVVRLRAFGLVAAALATAPPAPPVTSGVDQGLDPLGDLGQDLPVAVGSSG